MSEIETMRDIMRKAPEWAMRLFRNNVGRVQDKRTSGWINFGLCKGSSDLIGWKTIIVTQEMVGKPFAQFTACEVKSEIGKLTEEQVDFLMAVKQAGGIAIEARKVEDICL